MIYEHLDLHDCIISMSSCLSSSYYVEFMSLGSYSSHYIDIIMYILLFLFYLHIFSHNVAVISHNLK